VPASRREDPNERRKEGTIGSAKRGPRFLPGEHDKLMPQNEQFDVLGELATPAPDEQPQHRREREISEREEHPPMLPESPLASVESWNRRFETSQVDIDDKQWSGPVASAGVGCPSSRISLRIDLRDVRVGPIPLGKPTRARQMRGLGT
jgi:hypothetical protein